MEDHLSINKKMLMKRFLNLLMAFILFSVPLFAKEKAPQTLNQLIDSIRLEMDKNHIPGLLISIMKDDSVLYSGGLGYANLEDSLPVKAHHLFRMGSITKTFGALAMIRLEREGKIDLDQPLHLLAPEIDYKNRWKEEHPLTIRHLLHHTSGFDDMRPAAMYNRKDKKMIALDLVRNMESSMHCRWKPGTRFAYSNPNYIIIGYLIEKISGIPYEEYLVKNIFQPLGMKLTNLRSKPDTDSLYSTGYQWENGAYKKIGFRNIPAGMSGGLNSNARNMSGLLEFFIGDGTIDGQQVFSPGEISYMETPATTLAAEAGLSYGYGMGNSTSNYSNKIILHGHGGGIDGYRSQYAYSREHDLGFAISNNGGRPMNSISSLIINYLTRDIPKPEPEAEPIDQSVLEQYEGYYHYVSPRNELARFIERLLGGKRLMLTGDSLYHKPFMENPKKLVHTGGMQFRYADSNYPTMILLEKKNGKKAFSQEGSLYEKTGFWKIILLRVLVFGSVIIAFTLIPLMLIWGVMALLRNIPKRMFRRLLMPTGALLALIFTIASINVIVSNVFRFARFSFPSAAYFVFSVLFGILSLATLYYAVNNRSKIRSKLLRIYYYAVGISLTCIAIYLTYSGLIGYRFWVAIIKIYAII
jgi:CubicO group peptidase (beta-lactamase class C family)